MRIVVLVDSSATMAPMIIQFRAALNQFLNSLEGEPELALISTGGQLRVRVPPTLDRDKVRQAAASFASDGGGNAFLDSLLEADRRFLEPAADRRPVFVILTTDTGVVRDEPRVEQYYRFVRSFKERGGRAHGIVIRGPNAGTVSDILNNFTKNTSGFHEALLLANALEDRMKSLVELLALDQ